MIISKQAHDVNSVSSHYNDLDLIYREIWGEHVHHGLWITGEETTDEAVKQLVNYVADQIHIKPNMHVCDVGCGYGATARMLTERWKAKVTGLTISEAQFRYANALASTPDSPTYLHRDWLKNELPAASMDRVIAIESSEHFENKENFFREAARVLRPNGRLAVCAWLVREPISKFDERYLLEPICRECCLPSMGTKDNYYAWLRAAKFTNIELIDLSKFVAKTWSICIWHMIAAIFKNTSLRTFLFKNASPHRIFAKSVFRIRLAYAKGCMQYALILADK